MQTLNVTEMQAVNGGNNNGWNNNHGWGSGSLLSIDTGLSISASSEGKYGKSKSFSLGFVKSIDIFSYGH